MPQLRGIWSNSTVSTWDHSKRPGTDPGNWPTVRSGSTPPSMSPPPGCGSNSKPPPTIPNQQVASKLAHRVAADLNTWNWKWAAATTDNGNEFRSAVFKDTLEQLQVDHRYIRAGRPQTNGKAERVQGTLLEEFYQPTLIGYVQPSITGLRTDLNNYVHHYNWNRPHRGKWNQGKTPAQIIQPKTSITR